MATFLYRLGRLSFRRRRWVTVLWLVLLLGFGVGAGVRTVTCRCMSVVSGLFVLAGSVMLGRFGMMPRSMGVVFSCLGVMLRSFLRHRDFLLG